MAQSQPAQDGVLARLTKMTAKIEPREVGTVVTAFFLFFFVLGSYFVVRPVRETIAVKLGEEYVADLWLYTAILSIALVPAYGWLIGRVRRTVLLPCIYAAVAIAFVLIGISLDSDLGTVATGSFFYVGISVLNLFLVSVFWSFLLEIFTPEQSQRLFGAIAAGGSVGALVGPLTTTLTVSIIGNEGILFVGAAGFVGAIICQQLLIRMSKRDGVDATQRPGEAHLERPVGGNPFAGISIVLKSPYLLGIALFVVLLSAANTFVYFEQLRIVRETFDDPVRRSEVFALIDVVVQSLTILSQVFLTGRIASKLGVRVLLMIVPIVMVLGFITLSVVAIFPVLMVVIVGRRWGEYAFVRPGREMLFSRLSTETKYKAKNFIDVPVYRAADYVGGQVKTGLDALGGVGPSGAMLVAAVLATIWAFVGWRLGRKHDGATDAAARRDAHAAAE